MRTLLVLSFALYAAGAHSADKFPRDVARFIERRDGCDHFRGEDPYDEERRRFLERNMQKLCPGTDRELARLKSKYKGSPAIQKKLGDYEPDIELKRK